MLLIDDREQDIPSSFRPYGDVSLVPTRLDNGDFRWEGNGASGLIMVGVERKKIRDLIQSMRSRRLGGAQAPKLASECDVRYLVIEGIWRLGRTGAIEELRGRDWRSVGGKGSKPILWRELDSFLSDMEEFYGFRIAKTQTMAETAAFVVSRYKYWTHKYSHHDRHKECYAPTPDRGIGKKLSFVSIEDQIRRECGENAVYTWRFAAQLPGIDIKAEQVAKYFKEPGEMFRGTARDWTRAGFGPKTVEKIMEILHGSH